MPRASKPAPKTKPPREKSIVASSARQKMVVDAIMEGHSESDALRAAGYHPSNASKVMRQESVQEALAVARSEVENLTTIKRLDVMNLFLEAIQMARIQADPANMINGADKIAKMMGYYAPETKRIELTSDQSDIQRKLKQLSDADLIELASGRLKVIEGEVLQ